jgi:TetR/AcrR family transcriptional regulator, lmrAB and yxaGH operons repressor
MCFERPEKMPVALVSRENVIERLTDSFRRYGYEGATLARLEQSTGLKRPSLYHHFPGGKDEMARVVLDNANAWLSDHVLQPLADIGDPKQKLTLMTQALNRFYESGKESCLLGILSFGDARDLFQTPIRRALQKWIDAIATVLVEAGFPKAVAVVRAENAIRDIQGALVISRGLNSAKPFQRTIAELTDRLLSSTEE